MLNTQTLLIGLAALIVGWFAIGIIWNIRRGSAMLKWIQAGLPAIGEKTTVRWMGSSVVELVINKAKPPFRKFAILAVMQPRDVPWLWAFSFINARRDMLIIRAQLANAPRLEYDLANGKNWSGRLSINDASSRMWGTEDLERYQFMAPKASLPVSIIDARQLLDSARKISPEIYRLSVRREYPQVELHVPLPNPKVTSASEYFELIRAFGQEMSGG